MNEHRPSKNQLPEFTYEQIVEGKRPPVLSGPYIPAYLVRAEIERLTRELGVFKRYYGSSDDAICERNELRAEIDRLRAALNLARNLPECSPSIRALADEALRPAAFWNTDTFPNDQYAQVPIGTLRPADETAACQHDYREYSINNAESPADPPKLYKWVKCIKCGMPPENGTDGKSET